MIRKFNKNHRLPYFYPDGSVRDFDISNRLFKSNISRFFFIFLENLRIEILTECSYPEEKCSQMALEFRLLKITAAKNNQKCFKSKSQMICEN